MRPYDKTFDGWRELYYSLKEENDLRLEALENMALTARTRSEWSETYHIATDLEGFHSAHPFSVICTNGICFAPVKLDPLEASTLRGFFEKFRQFCRLKYSLS